MDNEQIGLFDGDDSNGSDDVNEQCPSVEEPSDLKNSPIYDLLFSSRERRAKKLFDSANEIGPGGQRTMRYE